MNEQKNNTAVIKNKYRSHRAFDVHEKNLGDQVKLAGWVHRRRDHGGVVFIDLIDSSGVCQLVISPENSEVFAEAEKIRNEFVLAVTGRVRKRPEGTVNEQLSTGGSEVDVASLTILNRSEPLPFSMTESQNAISEEVRMAYRYLDFRRDKQKMLKFRAKVISQMRAYLEQQEFIEVETPVLTKSTPEGAREYLVLSRLQKGHAYALPQSPQQFKQILMMGGVERYYQVVRCFRDEDNRKDRQPEFTQLDLEMSFVEMPDVMTMVEDMVKAVFAGSMSMALPNIPVFTYEQVMEAYGSDKPDLRNPLKLKTLDEQAKSCGFAVFEQACKHGTVKALTVPGAGEKLSRKMIDQYTKLVSRYGAKGLAYMKIEQDDQGGLQVKSPLSKFFKEGAEKAILTHAGGEVGDIIFFGAGHEDVVNASLSALRDQIGEDLDLIDHQAWRFLWVVDFPMFETDENGHFHARHHPFTKPKLEQLSDLEKPKALRAYAYDLVLNGFEIGGGSLRIDQSDIQKRIFQILGESDETIDAKFGHLLKALSYGAPPHGGFAMGLDRLLMLMMKQTSIRDVMAFPKTQNASCPLMHAPSKMESDDFEILGIHLREDIEQ